MSGKLPRSRLTWNLRGSLAAALLLLFAPPVSAATLAFDGPGGFGVSEGDALASGLPVLSSSGLQEVDGAEPAVAPLVRNVSLGPPAQATEDWTLTNNGESDLIGDVLLLFATPMANDAVSPPAEYEPSEVSLVLQNDGGGADWFLVQAFDEELGTLHYPAVSVGALLAGASSGFSLDYVLADPHVVFGPEGDTLVLPKWQVFPTFVPVPEPSTAWLVAGGLVGLALGRRRRA